VSETGQRRIDEIGDESRRRILDAAEELFAERGFDRTSFVDISARSGISRGSIPWHFKNKDGLVMAVLERSIRRAMPQEEYRENLPELPSLSRVVGDFATYLHESNPRLLFMILTQVMHGSGNLNELYSDFMRQQRDELAEWFRAQRPSGLDRDAAASRERSVATVINAAMLGVQLQWQVDPEGVDLDESLATLASLVDGHVRELYDGVPKAPSRARGATKATKKARSV
jgi:TetR/AcrR family acrAB operon transcriptional repressor